MSNAITVTLYGKKTTDISDNLVSLRVDSELNGIPAAWLVLSDGNFAKREYPLFDSPDLQIGAEVDIQIRYESTGEKDTSIFKGVVVSSCFGVSKGLPTLTVTMKDPAFRLVHAVKTTVFNKETDKSMIETAISGITGVLLKKTAAALTSVTYGQFIRKQVSAWDFVQERAAAFGLVIQLDNGALSILELTETTGTGTVELGIDDVVDIDLEQSALDLNKAIEVNYWDEKKNATGTVKKTSSSDLATKIKAPDAAYTLLNLTEKKEADGILQFFSTQETQDSLSGTVTVPGSSSWHTMQKLTLKSFPSAYNGSYAVSRVLHQVRFGVWTTTLGIGADSLKGMTSDVQNPSGPVITEMEFAVALKWAKDPDGLGRIPVKVLAFGKDTYWAYPAQVAAGAKQSSYLLPEENEQLIVGFMHGNYNQGFVITSTYLGSNKPPAPFKLDAKTPVGFLSTAGMKLVFDDQKTELELSTSGSNKQVMGKSGGVEVKTDKDFKVTSSGKTEVKASSKMTLKGATIDLN